MLKILAVRVPDTTHKYIKQKAISQDLSMQELIGQILLDYQKNDSDYQQKMNQSVTEALNGLATQIGERYV